MRDIRKAPTWDEVRMQFPRWNHHNQVSRLYQYRDDAHAFERLMEHIDAEVLKRCRMVRTTPNKFRTSGTTNVLYSLYLELKERFEEVDE